MVKSALFRVAHNSFHVWDEFLPAIQAGLNQRVPERTLSAPFALMFGRHFNQALDYTNETAELTSLEDWVELMKTMSKHVFPSLVIRTSQRDAQLTARFPDSHLMVEPFASGSLFMRRVNGLLPKSIPKLEGPYRNLNQSTNSQRYRLLCSDNTVLAEKILHDQLKLIDRPPENYAFDPTIPSRPPQVTVNLPQIAPITSSLSRPPVRPRGPLRGSNPGVVRVISSGLRRFTLRPFVQQQRSSTTTMRPIAPAPASSSFEQLPRRSIPFHSSSWHPCWCSFQSTSVSPSFSSMITNLQSVC